MFNNACCSNANGAVCGGQSLILFCILADDLLEDYDALLFDVVSLGAKDDGRRQLIEAMDLCRALENLLARRVDSATIGSLHVRYKLDGFRLQYEQRRRSGNGDGLYDKRCYFLPKLLRFALDANFDDTFQLERFLYAPLTNDNSDWFDQSVRQKFDMKLIFGLLAVNVW
ncbi:ORF164 [Leucania separata nucleopolyhedrovirus]|uniref:ORF164 n=1 Tax=Leucania separata nucleopolyhedrovirus TaxID=1307956 RepID=Q0IKV5_NPVLS|nr:ORF164 [Leucania separata nucleopolyhedrovirus]AAR28928.1 ORF164 [Leucania separata nucleopolyhedrovirus]